MADLEIRAAVADDVPAIVAMLADDPLGARRESPGDLTPYLAALQRLSSDPNQHLVVSHGNPHGDHGHGKPPWAGP